jgi:hypothetical protein
MANDLTNGASTNGAQHYDYQSYLENEEFQDFMKAAALEFIEESSLEELIEIVFGDMDEAIEAFNDAEYGDDDDDESDDDDDDSDDESDDDK